MSGKRPKPTWNKTMKRAYAKASGTKGSADKQPDLVNEVKKLKIRSLPKEHERRIERIIRWEEESQRCEFLIAGAPGKRVDPS